MKENRECDEISRKESVVLCPDVVCLDRSEGTVDPMANERPRTRPPGEWETPYGVAESAVKVRRRLPLGKPRPVGSLNVCSGKKRLTEPGTGRRRDTVQQDMQITSGGR